MTIILCSQLEIPMMLVEQTVGLSNSLAPGEVHDTKARVGLANVNSKLCKAFTVAQGTLGMFAGQVVDVNDASRDGKCPAAAAMELIFGPIVEAAKEMKSIQREHMGTATNSDRTKQFADLGNDMKILVKDNLVQIIPAVHIAGRKIQFEGIDAEWRCSRQRGWRSPP